MFREPIFTGGRTLSGAYAPAPPKGELLTRLQALCFRLKRCRHAKGSLSEGAGKTVRF